MHGRSFDGLNTGWRKARWSDLSRTHLHCGNAVGVDLTRATLQVVKATSVNPQHAKLGGTKLHGANFCCADLEVASLDGAIATESSFHRARLVGTRMVKVGPRDTDFFEAGLTRASCLRAHLLQADLTRAPACGRLMGLEFAQLQANDEAVFGRRPHGGRGCSTASSCIGPAGSKEPQRSLPAPRGPSLQVLRSAHGGRGGQVRRRPSAGSLPVR